MDEREKKLGFKPQKEIVYNTLLPYADKIDEESLEALKEIKGNLGRAIQLRDIKVGAGHWVGQLSRYIRLYGMKFSKEDHVTLVKVLFELITTPDLELSLVQKFSVQLVHLLKKRELLSREDLVLPWRPLYELCESVLYSRYEHYGLQLFPSNIETTLKSLVRNCRTYFPVESTQEMLDEWRPLICPYDTTIVKALGYMDHFLPTNLPPEHHDKGFKLWFQEMIDLWDSFQNSPSWETSFVNLFSRLANDNIGYIDWSPYLSKIFNRFLRSFNLPVGQQDALVGRSGSNYDMTHSVQWIVALLGGGSSGQVYVDKLFNTLQTFYHPSNIGKWTVKLSGLLMTFPKLFVRRLHKERYKKESWEQPIPESHKLTDNDVTHFVASFQPVVFTSMFSKYGSQDSAVALKHLSTMRPELIVPTLLEKMYPAMETLIEPHRLIACMNCVVSLARPMLRAGKWYPEGPSHVLPLLNLSIPGIDPNDFKKCLVTFQMISTFVAMIPIVDCSDAVHLRSDLTENERELCSATAQFEDFVLQFVDRVLMLIDNSAQEHTHGDHGRLNTEQSMLEIGMASTFNSVLQQCSAPIFESALNRLYDFVATSVYETKVSGRFTANLCRAVAKVNPKAALKRFLPTFCQNIKNHIKNHEEVLTDEHLDNGFLWNLLMLSQLIRCNGQELLPYKEELMEVICITIKLKCVEGYEIVGQLIRYLLRALTLIYSLDYKSRAGSFDEPLTDYLPIRDWALPGDVYNLGLNWHVPSHEEVEFAQQLLKQVLQPELVALKQLSPDNLVPREELLRSLNTVCECLGGASSLLTTLTGDPVQLLESQVPLKRFACQSIPDGTKEVTLDGENVRVAVIEVAHHLCKHMMKYCEDDTKGLHKLLWIYEAVLFSKGTPRNEFDGRWKSFHVVKSALQDQLRGGKKHLRALLVDRVQLQHELRQLNSSEQIFTQRHQDIMADVFTLSISQYSEVRKRAQGVLFSCFRNFPYSYRSLLPQIIKILRDKNAPEHHFKGALYLVQGGNKRNIATKRSWEVICEIWPAIVQAQHYEKPSILKVIDDIVTKAVKNVETTAIKIQVNQESLDAAQALLQTENPTPSYALASDEELQKGLELEVQRNIKAERMYIGLVEELVDLIQNGNLTWKFTQIGLEFLSLLLRIDIALPVKAVDLFVKFCLHDSLYIRKLSLGSLSAILKQHKRRHKKVTIDPYKLSGTTPPSPGDPFRPGVREDNQWHHYKIDSKLIGSKEKWESMTVIEKTHWGYYCWPSVTETYAPQSEQPKLDRCKEEMTEAEYIIYQSFVNPEYIKKLVDFLSLEEHKGKDKFRIKLMTLFKGLFRNYGDAFTEVFKPHVERLLNDTSHDKHDSSQRCGMEVLAGMLRGSKHLPYERVKTLVDWALPLLQNSLNHITVATIEDWGTFFGVVSESRDPRRLHWFLEMLSDNPLTGEGGSFGDASRLYMLDNALLQQEWRVTELYHYLLQYLKPHLSHTYKNVRDRIAGVLSNIFLYEYTVNKQSESSSPKRKVFLEEVLPQLQALMDMAIEEGNQQNGGSGSGRSSGRSSPIVNSKSQTDLREGEEPTKVDNNTEESEERKTLSRLCKTVLKFLSLSLGKVFSPAPPEVFRLLPIICTLESEGKDEELKHDCLLALTWLSQALLQPEVVSVVIATIKEITGLQSWHARNAVLYYMQSMVFYNFFILHNPKYTKEIQEIILHLLCDDQLEVREMAATTLSGFLHCGYLELNKDMLAHFERLRATKLKKFNMSLEMLIKRHAGVLGLSACVQAYPYDVPEFVPQILMDLGNHVNDPQPIQMTVKKTLSNFRRTHHDNWHDHKLMFTDDQLVVLTDLLVSPNYYA
ncbi:hypothetical protein ACJMK2_036330 [Sinanodonta woodiana]|uniref:Proteasome activator subunit 4 n=1 Tax=Sinanodonta woodiana TaxID=1069815 RepID=A0ABD3WGV9_SINWO